MTSILAKFLGGIALLITAGVIFVSNMPLGFVVNKTQLPEGIKIGDVRGSIWEGKSHLVWTEQTVSAAGFGRGFDLIWNWCPSADLINACVRVESPGIKGHGELAYSILGGKLYFKKFSFSADVPEYQAKYKTNEILLSGRGQLSMDDFFLQPGSAFPQNLRGNGKISDLTAQGIEVGEYPFKLTLEGQVLKVPFGGGTQAIDINGNVEVDFTDSKKPRYYYIANLTSKNRLIVGTLAKYAQFVGEDKLTFSGGGNVF